MTTPSDHTSSAGRRPVYEDAAAILRVIETAYGAAFSDMEARRAVAGRSATMGVRFEDLDCWFTVTIRDGSPAWQTGEPDAPDVAVFYRTARSFHTQFWDSQQFMADALQGAVEFHGSTQAGRLFGAFAASFQQQYQTLTREDEPRM